MSDSKPTVSVIIVSYNTASMTLDCLRSVEAGLDGVSAEIWVVDNASADESPAKIRAEFPQVQVIENRCNAGFGAANNQAMREARGEFLLLLNSDAFPKPGALAALVSYLREHPEVGGVGPQLLNADGSLQRSCWRFPSPGRAWFENAGVVSLAPNHPVIGDYSRWDHDSERTVEFVIGACLLIRRKVFEQVGGFDERFFMYAEEADWQRRMRDAGWPVVFTPAAQVTHLGGASGANEKARINRHFFESLDRYSVKHHGWAGLIALRGAMAFGALLRIPLFALRALVPGGNGRAWSKVRLHAWLLGRQLTHWQVGGETHSPTNAGTPAAAARIGFTAGQSRNTP